MGDYQKPLPVVNEDSRKFWEGCKEHRLVIQRCKDCRKFIFYPRSLCPECMSDNIEWVDSSGKGTIYSYTTIWRAPNNDFLKDVPYTIVLVDLEKNVRLMSWIVDCKPEDVHVGMEVEVVYDDVTNAVTLPKFRPIK